MKAKFVLCFSMLLAESVVFAGDSITVGVSWGSFEQERWKIDERGMKAVLEKAGALYVGVDAQASPEKQNKDIKELVEEKKVDALIVLTNDSDNARPVLESYASKIPIILYDRTAGMKGLFFITFDNFEVGRLQAEGVLEVLKPRLKKGEKLKVAFIKGDPGDGNSEVLFAGQKKALEKYIKNGSLTVVDAKSTKGWLAEEARKNMAEILRNSGGNIDAVVASNDSTAGGVIDALAEIGLAGKVPVSGQDADPAALNRVANGLQTVTVFKDARKIGMGAAQAALALVKKKPVENAKSRDIAGVTMQSLFLVPIAVSKDNLSVVVDAKWASKNSVCAGTETMDIAKKPSLCR
jgi:D-xylose transport system substrate-binding protein